MRGANGGGEAHAMAVQARGIAQRGCQMGLAEAGVRVQAIAGWVKSARASPLTSEESLTLRCL